MEDINTIFMRRALELARYGKGYVSPNPMVGCVIVHHQQIIGEGWHRKFGGAHAEANAIEAVADKDLLKKSTVYVTLEPCAHHGKTPPCAELLAQYGIKKVVICNKDPNPLVNGKGIQKLERARVEVMTGMLEEEGKALNKTFFHFYQKKRPYIILKWAETADGFIAKKDFTSKWISNDYARKLVHKWRAEEDAVMVGRNTAYHDNPKLTVRDWPGKNPLRILVDPEADLKKQGHLFDRRHATVCYNVKKDEEFENLSYVCLRKSSFLKDLLENLYHRQIQSVIVEGGGQLLHSFMEANLWDEMRLFKSEKKYGEGIKAPDARGALVHIEDIMSDKLLIYSNL